MPGDHDKHGIRATIGAPSALSSGTLADFAIETILRLTLASTGATSAQFLVCEHDEARPRARALRRQEVIMQFGAAVEQESAVRELAHSVMRSGVPAEPGTTDMPCSALCVPLLCEHSVVAMLYLEHDHVGHAFRGKTRETIDALSEQIAATLDSARKNRTDLDALQQRWLAESEHSLGELSRASKVATVGEIVASIVHEMSQPLSAIDASSGAALRWLQRDIPDVGEATISLEKVQTCTARARDIIERLRALNRQARKPFEPFEVHAVIREAILQSRLQIDRAGATVEVVEHVERQSVLGSGTQIQQVIEHLIENALEAMADIDDRPRAIRISSVESEASGMVISVADSGPGIAPDDEEKIFRPFFTTKPQGLGMGLPICKRIIEAHGGTIWAEPGDPFGIRFSFSLGPS